MVDSWNSAVLYDLIRKQKQIPALLDQVETKVWNLVRLPYYNDSTASNGITFDIKPGGSIDVSGTATANANILVKWYTQNFKLPAGNYHLKGCPADGSVSSYNLRVGRETSGGSRAWLGYDVGDGFTFTLTEECSIAIMLNVMSGTAIGDTPITFKPEIDVVELPVCDKTTAGNYSLKATVDSDGVVTYSWEAIT